MSRTHTIGQTWGAGGELLATQVTVTGSVEQNFSLALGTVTDQVIDLEWAQAKLKSLFVTTDHDCTLEINSSSAPTDTIALKAGVPFCWVKDSGVKYPFVGTAGAVTAGYLTTTEATNVEIRALLDL